MRRLVKFLLERTADVWSRGVGYSFPAKYTWRWKLDVLAERYEPETTKLFKEIVGTGMTVVDIGAHIGYFTRLAANRVGPTGHVYAFEADTENINYLRANTNRFPQVTVTNAAVSSRDGTVDFYHVNESTGLHSIFKPERPAKHFSVVAVSIDSFVSRNRIPHIDVIKMDIEGGESDALEGMSRTIAQEHLSIIMEWNPPALKRANAQPEELISKLFAAGFSLSVIGDAARIPFSKEDMQPIHQHFDHTGSVNIFAVK